MEQDSLDIDGIEWGNLTDKREERVCKMIEEKEESAGLIADKGNIGAVRFSWIASQGRNPKEQGLAKGFTHDTHLEDNSSLLDHSRVLALRLNCREENIVMQIAEVPGKLTSKEQGLNNIGQILVPGGDGIPGVYHEVKFYLTSSSQIEDGEREKDAITSDEEGEVMKDLRMQPAWRESQRLIRNLRRFNRCRALHEAIARECKRCSRQDQGQDKQGTRRQDQPAEGFREHEGD